MNALRDKVAEIADFPQPGILFRDIGPLLRGHLDETLQALESLLSPADWDGIDVVGVIDARGFVLGSALAARRGLGVAMIRKAGKLPPPVRRVAYSLEYGEAALEMQPGSGRLLLVDDVLATGGTLRAAAALAEAAGYELRGAVVLVDLGMAPDLLIAGRAVPAAIRYPD
jgi:adenine phosphoribosyltransferase